MKYLAIQDHNKSLIVYLADQASYTPAGWHRPIKGVFPARKRGALVTAPHIIVAANNARIVDDQTTADLDQIDTQIITLRKQRNAIIVDRFLTFRLVLATDLENATAKVYASEAEARNAFKPAGA